MVQYLADDPEIPFVNCAVCDNAIVGGKWFARIKHGEYMVALCCPLCTEVFERDPKPYMRRVQTLCDMQNSSFG